MLSKKLEKELNNQLNAEMYSAYLYLSMSAFVASQNLDGFSHWLKLQFAEEQEHAMKLYQFILDRGGRVIFTAIDQPQSEWKDVIEVMEETFKHEQKVTSLINNLVDLAIEEKDHATVTMLQWFVNEQVEEENSAEKILLHLKMINGKGSGLLMLDREMGARTQEN